MADKEQLKAITAFLTKKTKKDAECIAKAERGHALANKMDPLSGAVLDFHASLTSLYVL